MLNFLRQLTLFKFAHISWISLYSILLCIPNCAIAQNSLVKKWDYRYGGSSDEDLRSLQRTSDGGYILGGSSFSGISGDKTQACVGDLDYWMVKVDSSGIKQWDKTFGGSEYDQLFSLIQTTDGGYLLGGYSYSDISGDKTQIGLGGTDYWIVKTDAAGNKQWDKTFGGTNDEYLYSVDQTSDGGFILGGSSASGISGDKTQLSFGGEDYWIIKTDSLGSRQWDMAYGGNDNETLIALEQTSDGGFILGGRSFSPISGNKMQAGFGSSDYWMVKTDNLGIKQWEMDYGGVSDDAICVVKQTPDSGYIIGGRANSDIGGNKFVPLWGTAYDYWIIKTDALGNRQWEKDFGGTDHEDEFSSISLSVDGGYLLAGTSYSNISGNKTENNLGSEQTWVLKLDMNGDLVWDKTPQTLGHDEVGLVVQTSDGCYVVANYDGGTVGGEKSQPSWNNTKDFWIIKYCDSQPIASLAAVPGLCPGTCTGFINLSINALNYQWYFPGAIPDTSTAQFPTNICYNIPGTYDLTLIASNSFGSDTLILSNSVLVYPYPPPQAVTQNGDTLFANNGAVSYQWYYNAVLLPGATNYFYVATASGNFNVVATDSNGCEVEAAVFDVTASIQSTYEERNLDVKIFPNPAANNFTIDFPAETDARSYSINIFDIIGRKVSTDVVFKDNNVTINSSKLQPDLYIVEICKDEKTFYRGRIVIQ